MKSFFVLIAVAFLAWTIAPAASKELDALVNNQTSSSQVLPEGISSIRPWSISYVNSPQPITQPSSGSGSGNVSTASQSSNTASNWSGYAASGGKFSSVSGSWVVPQASSSGDTSADATWIGIGGYNSSDLIQVGTQNIVSPNGQVSTSAFYEMLPDTSVTIPNVTINSGDSISASIVEASTGEWTINFVDNTSGDSYSINVSYDSSQSSAEWIEEDPSDEVSQIALDNFGSVSFSNGSTTENGSNETISGSQAQAITMVNGQGQVLASASALGSDGSSFSVSRSSASTVDSSIEQFNNSPGSWSRHGIGIRQFNDSN